MKTTSTFNEMYQKISAVKVPFFLVFFVIVFITYAILFAIDFIPEPLSEETKQAKEVKTASAVVGSVTGLFGGAKDAVKAINGGLRAKNTAFVPTEPAIPTTSVVIPETRTPSALVAQVDPLPLKIIFDDLEGRTVTVNNPTSRSIADLDEALLSGVVRHPDSADFQNVGNILILGHSSYLPNVFNKSFQAFNGIQQLTWGDKIRVQSADTEYVYQVDKVFKAPASEVVVDQSWGEAKLTLATCNSFGSKDDRFIVEATLVSSKPL